MKLRHISALVTAGLASAAIAAAPAAAAAPAGPTCTYVGSETTRCESPGNVQINSDYPVQYPYPFPFYPDFLLFHHNNDRNHHGGHHR